MKYIHIYQTDQRYVIVCINVDFYNKREVSY